MNKVKNRIAYFAKLESVIVVSTFFSLWLAVIFEDALEYIVAYLFILSFGILHGANDLNLILKNTKNTGTSKNYLKVLLYYVLFVLASIGLFYLIPSLALFVFVVFSGYHFGEQHLLLKTTTRSWYVSLLYLVYGLFILFLLFRTNYVMTNDIIQKITQFKIPLRAFDFGLWISGLLTACLGTLAVLQKKIKINVIKELFFLAVFFVVFKTASLLWGFAIYFILWHSIPSLIDQMFYLHGEANRKTFYIFFKSSFPYWLISIVGLFMIIFLFRDNLETSLAFFFSFLAAITFPHVLVINRLNKPKTEF